MSGNAKLTRRESAEQTKKLLYNWKKIIKVKWRKKNKAQGAAK